MIGWLSGLFFCIFAIIIIFCFVIVIFDLLHNVEATMTFVNSYQLLEMLTEIWLMPMKLQICSFMGITYILENISSC